jgi:GTP-binding protein
VDVSGASERDPVSDFKIISNELRSYNPELLNKPKMVALSKADAITDRSGLDSLTAYCKEVGIDTILISSVTGLGIQELVNRMGAIVSEARSAGEESANSAAVSGV